MAPLAFARGAAGEGFDVDLRAADASEKSRIILDWCSVARHVLAAEGDQSGWDKRAGKLWVTAPGGWTLSVYVDRMPAAAGYPVRAMAVTGRDSVRACRFEIAISILGVGTDPPPRCSGLPNSKTVLWRRHRSLNSGSLASKISERRSTRRIAWRPP